MNSFWMPKKQPLYAPMLATFGGGSVIRKSLAGPSVDLNYFSEDSFQYFSPTQMPTGSSTTSRELTGSYLKAYISGQGRGVLGNGTGDYQLLCNFNGTGSFGTAGHDTDPFFPGTPHEGALVAVDGSHCFGGKNESNGVNSLTDTGATAEVYQITSTYAVVHFSGVESTYGEVFFHYIVDGEVLRMCQSYFNTTGSSKSIRMTRGGDPDFDAYPTTNAIVSNLTATATGTTSGKTICYHVPNTNNLASTKIRSAIVPDWSSKFGTPSINDTLAGSSDNDGDHAIYMAVDFGSVLPDEEVHQQFYYSIASSKAAALTLLDL